MKMCVVGEDAFGNKHLHADSSRAMPERSLIK